MFESYDVIWLTGQPGAGKTSIGKKIQEEIAARRLKKSVLVDGDDIRTLFENKDYSIDGRRNNIVFVQKMAEFLIKNDIIPIICLVSPFRDLREETKSKYKTLEIYLHCSEQRGRENFHVNYYEMPLSEYIDIDTTSKTTDETFIYLKSIVK